MKPYWLLLLLNTSLYATRAQYLTGKPLLDLHIRYRETIIPVGVDRTHIVGIMRALISNGKLLSFKNMCRTLVHKPVRHYEPPLMSQFYSIIHLIRPTIIQQHLIAIKEHTIQKDLCAYIMVKLKTFDPHSCEYQILSQRFDKEKRMAEFYYKHCAKLRAMDIFIQQYMYKPGKLVRATNNNIPAQKLLGA
jgi:hypothetical protein